MCVLDINECETDNGGCEHICTNTQSSFYCSCQNGYELLHHLFCSGISITCNYDNSGNTISDINECETNECDQDCVNTLGSVHAEKDFHWVWITTLAMVCVPEQL